MYYENLNILVTLFFAKSFSPDAPHFVLKLRFIFQIYILPTNWQ